MRTTVPMMSTIITERRGATELPALLGDPLADALEPELEGVDEPGPEDVPGEEGDPDEGDPEGGAGEDPSAALILNCPV